MITNNVKCCPGVCIIKPPDLEKIDHEGLFGQINWSDKIHTKPYKTHIWNFKKTNYVKYARAFAYFLFKSRNPVLMFIELYKCIHNSAHKYILMKHVNKLTNAYTYEQTRSIGSSYNA